ncbi:MAG TPA: hypothetical protein PLE45_00640 [Spirochaetota bacterium]|nr:hypothetical protein [Spirochaetota bacterium]HPP03299.1 hypothetical protein [Spirochaetota bacterium]
MKKYILFFVCISFLLNGNEKDLTDDLIKKFNEEKLSYIVKKRFEETRPLDVVDFYFYKGENLISFEEFISLTNDPLYYKNLENIKNTKIAGFTTAGILGACTVSFIIPSAILTTNAVSYNLTEQLKTNYFMSGIVSAAFAVFCGAALIIDLVVTFSLLHKYENNENLYRIIIERYNKRLKESLLIIPDVSLNSDRIDLFLNIKI